MFVTLRSTFSTLGVILGACTVSATTFSQSLSSGAPPTAGFADPTPEEQRLLGGGTSAPVAAGGSSRPVGAEARPAYAPSATTPQYTRTPQYAGTPQGYAPSSYAPPSYAAPRYAPSSYAPSSYAPSSYAPHGYTEPRSHGAAPGYAYAPPSGGYGNERYAYSTGGASSDTAADRGGGGAAKNRDDKPEHFRIGVLGGVGFPRPFALEGMIKLEKLLGLGVEYSTTPSLTISGVDTSYWAIAATLRVFPFKDGFFLGVRGGRQHLGGEGTVSVAPYGTFRESVTVDTTFINPRIGFLWTWSSGITLGIDAGVQIPVGATVASSLPAGTGVDQEVMEVARSIGDTTLPTIDLLKLGFLL